MDQRASSKARRKRIESGSKQDHDLKHNSKPNSQSFSINSGLQAASKVALAIVGGHTGERAVTVDRVEEIPAVCVKEPEDTPSSSSGAQGNSDWKSTASNTAKLFLNIVKEGSDIFPPLKCALGASLALLNSYEVSMP
jgi:hypothetical protein